MVLANTSTTALLVTSTFCKERQHVGSRNHRGAQGQTRGPCHPLPCPLAPAGLRPHARTTAALGAACQGRGRPATCPVHPPVPPPALAVGAGSVEGPVNSAGLEGHTTSPVTFSISLKSSSSLVPSAPPTFSLTS